MSESYAELWVIYYASGGVTGRLAESAKIADETVAHLNANYAHRPDLVPCYAVRYRREAEVAEAERRGARATVLWQLRAALIDREKAELTRRAIEDGRATIEPEATK